MADDPADLPSAPTELLQETDAEFIERAGPALAALEQTRRRKYAVYLHRRRTSLAVFGVLSTLAVMLEILSRATGRFGGGDHHRCAWLAAAAGVVLFFWTTSPAGDYAAACKKELMPRIARALGLSRYAATGVSIPDGELVSSKIWPAHDDYRPRDYFEGVYKGAAVRFSEALLKQTKDKYGGSEDRILFNGLILLVDMPRKRFSGTTVMLRNHPGLLEWFEERSLGLARVNLVDPGFEKKYTVYASDQMEARYLLDPAMMERVERLVDICRAFGARISYYDNKVLVLLPFMPELFEAPGIAVPLKDAAGILTLKHRMQRILDLVDCVDDRLSRADRPAAQA